MIFLYSITKKQQEQQHLYDSIPIKPLSPFNNDDNIANDPAYSVFTNITIKTDKDTDLEYKVEDTQTRQVKTDDIEIVKNPAHSETKFN